MRVLRFLALSLSVAACGGSSRVSSRPFGVDDHLDEARRHETDAEREERIASDAEAASRNRMPVCGDVVIADQVTSGGERIHGRKPCWSAEQSTADRHHAEAARLRADARVHRARARELLEAERASCATLPAEEMDHTPFAHREDITWVGAELDGTKVRGARIRFRAVEGLSADWLRTAIACHQARAAALGYDAGYMGYDPTAVAGAEVEVVAGDDGIVVIVRATDDAAALAVYGRAEALVGGKW
jgi:hypothetical protein